MIERLEDEHDAYEQAEEERRLRAEYGEDEL